MSAQPELREKLKDKLDSWIHCKEKNITTTMDEQGMFNKFTKLYNLIF
jgi:spore coat protein CotF